ncbi:MAG: penicillin acylase family protein, partial [Pseudomonas sp.]
MNPWLRWSLGGLLALVSVLALAVLGAGAWLAHSLPQRDGQLPLHGLSAPVSVRFDAQGVPHIQAQQEADAYRALGFLHAQERLFQMEILRRLSRGELAEMLGPSLLKADRLFRTLRLR